MEMDYSILLMDHTPRRRPGDNYKIKFNLCNYSFVSQYRAIDSLVTRPGAIDSSVMAPFRR